MFDTIILLTGPSEAPALASALRPYNAKLAYRTAATLAELEAIEPTVLGRSRVIGFATSVVVPTKILDAVGFGAYNFHPGPPEYPGWVPAHFAIYDRAARFGATAHVMIEKVDAGPIVGVERFAIPPQIGVVRLQELAFVQLARLFWRLAPALAAQSQPLAVLAAQWSGRKSTRRSYAAMCDIPAWISKHELERRIEVFGNGHYDIGLTVTLHGHAFRYVAPAPNAKVQSPSIVPEPQHVMEPA